VTKIGRKGKVQKREGNKTIKRIYSKINGKGRDRKKGREI
jgi:hypothetical protein